MVAPVFTSIGGGCGTVSRLPATMAMTAVPSAAQKTIASKVIGMNAGQAAKGLPPKFIGQSQTMT